MSAADRRVILHLDSSARDERSHTRRLSQRFVDLWRERRPEDTVLYRDLGRNVPPPVNEKWIAAAFTEPPRRTPGMWSDLATSDALVDELIRADVLVAGVPMYNFGVPAPMKAYVDNIVRVGRTFGFDPSRPEEPYWPMLVGKRMVVMSSRGAAGYSPGESLAHMNFVEPYLKTVFGWLGVSDFASVAVEYDEFGGKTLQQSFTEAERALNEIVQSWTVRVDPQPAQPSTVAA